VPNILWTYNGIEQDGKTPTYGGYSLKSSWMSSTRSDFPEPSACECRPLLCAHHHLLAAPAISTSPRGSGSGRWVGRIGHMAVKLAASMGAEVTASARRKPRTGCAPPWRAGLCRVRWTRRISTALANRFDF